jgi:hypothetical protein
MNRHERQQELSESIEGLEGQRAKIAQDVKGLEVKRNEHVGKLESLKKAHATACRAEALGQSNDREKIDRDIAAASAKAAGFTTLISEKQAEISRIVDQVAPLEAEFNKLNLEEHRERCLAEIEQSFKDGVEEVKMLFVLEKNFSDRIGMLRSKYDNEATDVRSAAYGAAEKLSSARNGVRLQEILSPADVKEMRAAKLIS